MLRKTPLAIKYYSESFVQLQNFGFGFTVSPHPDKPESFVTGGPADSNTYKFMQFHMHWGATDCAGSEHLIDGMPYAAEVI